MTRLFTFAAVLTVVLSSLSAQVAFNTTLRGQLQYNQTLNDVWGYVDEANDIEYALVGARNGLSIVSLENPDNPTEVQFIDGDPSIWRDMKTYENYAYVTTDQGDDGLLVVDMSGTPGAYEFQYINLPITGSNEVLFTAHNLYIDTETGILFISGGNYNGGGMVLYDLTADPYNPTFISVAPNVYAHDVYVQDNIMYSSEINNGRLAIYDITDPLEIIQLGTRITPFAFCHNAWTTTDAQYVFTTDERPNASTAAYDISDPNNPILVDEFRPNRSLGEGSLPHNTHVLDDYLVISHYSDGLEIVDASSPGNMIEVGYYDTWTGSSGGDGCWGAYPYLPSGLVLATDISNGLFVVEVDYQRAAQLTGNVTNANDGSNLNNVSVSILSDEEPLVFTDASGNYQAGQVNDGTFDVIFSAAGFVTQTLSVDLVQGEVAELDVALVPLEAVSISGNVTNAIDNSPIEGASVIFESPNGNFEAVTDADGNIAINSIFTGDYEVFVGLWGFQNEAVAFNAVNNGEFSIQLTPGYLDGFAIDQGWTNQFFAESGEWTRAVPTGNTSNGEQVAPGMDSDNAGDLGNQAYVTGNTPGGAGLDDIDDGTVRLFSPLIDLSIYGDNATDFVFSYDYWYFNAGGGGGAPDDVMSIALLNGSTPIDITEYFAGTPNTISSAWTPDSFRLSDFGLTAADVVQFVVIAEDNGEGHLSEAGLDNFKITADFISSDEEIAASELSIDVFPNPSSELFSVSYTLPSVTDAATLKVIDLKGRLLQQIELANNAKDGTISLGQALPIGSYNLLLEVNGKALSTTTIIKQ